ncbi:ectoine/hydroxyectoine ABC transporter permease subunit EhuC [Rhodobacter sp. NSM]|uniref:ectoine/hydroxyectoine ABC transporter permease subunit EhuC n=1 Tax=Rhodobacter sp. NSM TaxID=3457501 RepID=UPI003FD20236
MGIPGLATLLLAALATLFWLSGLEAYRPFVPGLLEGAAVTLQITALGCGLAVTAALAAGLARLYAPAPLRWLATVYVELFRGTSALVQLFWLYFVLPQFGVNIEAFTAAVLGLGLNIGAYGAEVVRGAVTSVPRGQWEAGIALNMGRPLLLHRIVLPQALAAMVPPWGNLFIELLKATSLVSLITLGDLTFRAQQMNQTTMKTTEIFTLVLLGYLVLSLSITIAMRLLERRAGRGLARRA